MSLRELWYAACGAWDVEISARAFWKRQFGVQVSAEDVLSMHPLRRREIPPPPEKTPEEKKQESKWGWKLFGTYLKQSNKGR